MDRIASIVRPIVNKKYFSFPQAFGGEIVRKALHLLIAFVPLLAGVDLRATMMLLALALCSTCSPKSCGWRAGRCW